MLGFLSSCIGNQVDPSLSKGNANVSDVIESNLSDLQEGASSETITCTIPLPPSSTRSDSKNFSMNSETGKRVEITSTIIRPKKDFYFANEKATGIEDAQGRIIKLEWIDEMKIHDQVFGYIIFARPGIRHADGSIGLDHLTAYRCFDSDGDRSFELLETDMSMPSKVPEWAVTTTQ